MGFEGIVKLDSPENCVVDPSAHDPRSGWDEVFAEMAEFGDDRLLDPDLDTDWDEAEWPWYCLGESRE
jgi:hypothetical protein